METLARELKTLTENPTYADRLPLINTIIDKLTAGEEYPENQLIEDLENTNLRFFAAKVAGGDYGRD